MGGPSLQAARKVVESIDRFEDRSYEERSLEREAELKAELRKLRQRRKAARALMPAEDPLPSPVKTPKATRARPVSAAPVVRAVPPRFETTSALHYRMPFGGKSLRAEIIMPPKRKRVHANGCTGVFGLGKRRRWESLVLE